jgi:hypothetical protein
MDRNKVSAAIIVIREIQYTGKKDISFQKQYSNIAIEESNREAVLLVDSYPSMFLPPLGDL